MTDTSVHFHEKRLWRMINAGLLICIGLFGGGRMIGISSVGGGHVFAASVALLLAALLDRASLRGRIFGLLGAGIIMTDVSVVIGPERCMQFFHDYVEWLVGGSGWRTEWSLGYELVQTVWLVWGCCVLELVLEKDFRVKAAAAFALLAALLYALFMEKAPTKFCVVLSLCYLALTYAEWTQIRWRKEKGRSIQAYMLWILPFMGVYVILMLLSAAPDDPYEWRFVKNLYGQISESVTKLSYHIMSGDKEEYDLTLSGFSGRGEVGDDMQESTREIMKIWDDTGLTTNVYLSGKIYDTFDGRQWKQNNEDMAVERYIDTIETECAVREYDNQHFADYLKYADFRVDYRYFRSEFLFAPLKAANIRQDGGTLGFREVGGSLLFDRSKGYGTTYRVSFYQLNVGRSEFDMFLEEAGEREADDEILARALQDMERRTGMHIDMSDLEAHRQNVEMYYTEDVELSEDVQEYLDRITAHAWTDLERLRAIEAELSSFEYTLTPGELPGTVTDSGTFLDYFLLDSRAGYCSHFATAFTLLARAQGLPARYVQGFCVPMKGGGETMVYSDMAHGWSEVYLEGIGWIPFEPTPGYAELRYTPWAVQSEWADGTGEQGKESTQLQKKKEPVQVEETVENEVEAEGGNVFSADQIMRVLRAFAILLLSALSAGVIIYVLNRLIRRYRYRRMTVGERFRAEVYRNLQILSLMGIGIKEETLEEFRIRAEQLLPQKEALSFLTDYEEVLYGNGKVDAFVLENAIRQQRTLVALLKKKRKWMYLYYRFMI